MNEHFGLVIVGALGLLIGVLLQVIVFIVLLAVIGAIT